MARLRIRADQLLAGRPLPFDTFDEQGNLLLRKGYVVESEGQLARIIDRGLFLEGHGTAQTAGTSQSGKASVSRWEHYQGKRVSVFTLLDAVHAELAACVLATDTEDLPASILKMVGMVQRICKLDADAALASLVLEVKARYCIRRLVHTAIITELLLARDGNDEARRVIPLAAALTMNVAMLELQDVLYHQKSPPDTAQMETMRDHPNAGATWLSLRGVKDPVWLELVRQHHETIDGTGYPRGLVGNAVRREAQVISLADRYGSLVSGRAYRLPMLPSMALREVYAMQGKSVDAALVAQLVKEVGIYPPGSLVHLANGDIAVVVKRMPHAHQPVVRAVKNMLNQRLPGAPKRLTREPMFAIKKSASPEQLGFQPDPAHLWDETFEFDSAA